MMDLVNIVLAILGFVASVGLRAYSGYTWNRIIWSRRRICKATWSLAGAFAISAVGAVVLAVQFICYAIAEQFLRTPQNSHTVLLLIEAIVYVLFSWYIIYVYTSEKDRDNIVFWPSQR